MAIYTKQTGTGGPWLDKDTVRNGQKFAILTEVKPIEEIYKGEQNIRNTAKLKVEGMTEPQNMDLNKPTIAGLIDAFGADSRAWIGKVLTAHSEKVRVAGRAGTMVILIPDGFKVQDDEGGYATVVPLDTPPPKTAQQARDEYAKTAPPASPGIAYPEEEINPEDIPF